MNFCVLLQCERRINLQRPCLIPAKLNAWLFYLNDIFALYAIDKIKQYKGQMRPDIRLKLASDEYNSAKKDFVCAVNKWFEENYKPKEGEDDVMFSDAFLRSDGDIAISYSYCNFETMDAYYNRLIDDDGHYYGSLIVKPEEIFK